MDKFLNKIIHGDCLELMKSIEDQSIDMILADLPYGTTACKWDSIIPFQPLWEQYERIIKDNGAIVLTASQPFTSALIMSNPNLFKYEWIWDKVTPTGHTVAKLRPMQLHESIVVFSKGTTANRSKNNMLYNPQDLVPFGKVLDGARQAKENYQNQYRRPSQNKKYVQEFTNYPKTILRFPKQPSKESIHPTQKPVALFEYLISTYTQKGMLVLDNCIGSGTTAVAALNTGRFFIGMEKEKAYVDLANERILNHKKQLSLL